MHSTDGNSIKMGAILIGSTSSSKDFYVQVLEVSQFMALELQLIMPQTQLHGRAFIRCLPFLHSLDRNTYGPKDQILQSFRCQPVLVGSVELST